MNTYLFTWNPAKWNWQGFEQSISRLANKQPVTKDWRCASHKKVQAGDRAFLAKVGVPPRGIIGSGTIITAPFLARHRHIEGKEIYLVTVQFDTILNSNKEEILTNDILNLGNLAAQNWSPQGSGISIRPQLVDELEALWLDFLSTR